MNKFCGDQLAGSELVIRGKANAQKQIHPMEIIPHGPRGSDHRETAETYHGELFRLGCYRVVVCRGGLQWLYQRRRCAISPRGVAWNTVGYCLSRFALARLHRAYNGTDAQEISALPSHFGNEGAK